MYQKTDTAHSLAVLATLPVSALTHWEVKLNEIRTMTVVTIGHANFARLFIGIRAAELDLC